VTVEDDAITPQPRTEPVRPAGRPLRGAKITGFRHPANNRYELDYTLAGETRSIHYSINTPTTFTFTFIDPSGERTETYERRPRRQKKRP
jgi:YD repeat-containing protein